MNKQEAYEQLHQAGFTGTEIYWLLQLRERYVAEQARRQEAATFARLRFIRWLLRTGRLTEQTTRQEEPVEADLRTPGQEGRPPQR
jgi:hypothetical protein